MIRQKVKSGELFQVGKAVYSEERHVPELAVLAFKYPHAIITMYSAFLYIHFSCSHKDCLTFAPDEIMVFSISSPLLYTLYST